MRKVILSADSACDIGSALREKHGVNVVHYGITLGEHTYIDGVDITPDEIYRAWWDHKLLPKTNAVNVEDHMNHFRPHVEAGCDVIHISLGSGLSSSFQNACIAAEELGHVYPVDSRSLSTGTGLLVLEAADMIASGMDAPSIQAALCEARTKVSASFVIDTTEFLRAGGRCSALTAFGANLLNIKPEIIVREELAGSMTTGKKYRGKLDKVLEKYAHDVLETPDIDTRRAFITHSGISEERIELVRSVLEKVCPFDEVYVTRAGCTISCHCGPNTLGVLFLTK